MNFLINLADLFDKRGLHKAADVCDKLISGTINRLGVRRLIETPLVTQEKEKERQEREAAKIRERERKERKTQRDEKALAKEKAEAEGVDQPKEEPEKKPSSVRQKPLRKGSFHGDSVWSVEYTPFYIKYDAPRMGSDGKMHSGGMGKRKINVLDWIWDRDAAAAAEAKVRAAAKLNIDAAVSARSSMLGTRTPEALNPTERERFHKLVEAEHHAREAANKDAAAVSLNAGWLSAAEWHKKHGKLPVAKPGQNPMETAEDLAKSGKYPEINMLKLIAKTNFEKVKEDIRQLPSSVVVLKYKDIPLENMLMSYVEGRVVNAGQPMDEMSLMSIFKKVKAKLEPENAVLLCDYTGNIKEVYPSENVHVVKDFFAQKIKIKQNQDSSPEAPEEEAIQSQEPENKGIGGVNIF